MVNAVAWGGFFRKVGRFTYMVGGIYLIGKVILTIINSIIFGITMKNWRPLWDNTAGQIFASETFLKKAMLQLHEINANHISIPFDYVSHIKSQISDSLLILGVFVFLIGYVWWKQRTWRESDSSLTPRRKMKIIMLVVILTLLTWGGIEYTYNTKILKLGPVEGLPFQGLYSLYKYRSDLGEFGEVQEKIFGLGLEDYTFDANDTLINITSSEENISTQMVNTISSLTTFS